MQEDDPPPATATIFPAGDPSGTATLTATMTPEAPASNPPVSTPFGRVRAQNYAWVRQGPGIEFYCLGEVKGGSEWPIIGKILLDDSGNVDWWQIRWNDEDVWIGSNVFSGVETAGVPTRVPQDLPPTVVPSEAVFGRIEINDGTIEPANLRSGPSTKATVIKSIPQKHLVEVLALNDDGEWVRVRWCGNEGWVFAEYVTLLLPDGSAAPTDTPAATETPTPTPTRTPQLGDILSVPLPGGIEVERVFVPRGSFRMGANDGAADEGPEHEVRLDAFWMDRTEVTNEQYAACVEAGECQTPSERSSAGRTNYYGNSRYAGFPVIFVSWQNARDFCEWAGGKLPTEAEWEYAARGPNSFNYPWGNDPQPDCSLLNFANCIGDTSISGNYPSGQSWVGALDMAGNVWEWTQDWFSGDYYELLSENTYDPQGPLDGTARVLRGGAWNSVTLVRSANRNGDFLPDYHLNNVGIRCVQER